MTFCVIVICENPRESKINFDRQLYKIFLNKGQQNNSVKKKIMKQWPKVTQTRTIFTFFSDALSLSADKMLVSQAKISCINLFNTITCITVLYSP